MMVPGVPPWLWNPPGVDNPWLSEMWRIHGFYSIKRFTGGYRLLATATQIWWNGIDWIDLDPQACHISVPETSPRDPAKALYEAEFTELLSGFYLDVFVCLLTTVFTWVNHIIRHQNLRGKQTQTKSSWHWRCRDKISFVRAPPRTSCRITAWGSMIGSSSGRCGRWCAVKLLCNPEQPPRKDQRTK